MSIMRCETHDRNWDSDNLEDCHHCITEQSMRPQDDCLDGSHWLYANLEHGGKYPDTMPQAILATDDEGRSWVYIARERAYYGPPVRRKVGLKEALLLGVVAPLFGFFFAGIIVWYILKFIPAR